LLTEGSVVNSPELITGSELEKTDFYQDLLRPFDLYHAISMILQRDSQEFTAITVLRSKRLGPFQEDDVKIMKLLLPHFQQASRLERQIAELESEAGALRSTFDLLSSAIVLTDETGKVLRMNRAAESIFQLKDGLTVHTGRIATAIPPETGRLQRMLRDAALMQIGIASRVPAAMLVSRPSERRPYSLLISPALNSELRYGLERKGIVIAVFISDTERDGKVDGSVLQQLYGCTRAEARLASYLADGGSLQEAANEFGVSRNTVRTQLAQTMNKTGTRRQSELVRLLTRYRSP
jgi:DNA-binding CsgD family transcriptional regulator/PAS domain-containing protein